MFAYIVSLLMSQVGTYFIYHMCSFMTHSLLFWAIF